MSHSRPSLLPTLPVLLLSLLALTVPRAAAQGVSAEEAERELLRQLGYNAAEAVSPSPAATAPRARRKVVHPQHTAPAVEQVPPTRAEAADLVRRFLAVSEGSDAAAEAAIFAPEVDDYLGLGRRSRRAVARDQDAYRRRWPARRFELLGQPTVGPGGVVHYRLRYELQNAGHISTGETDGEITLRRAPATGPGGKSDFGIAAVPRWPGQEERGRGTTPR